MELYYGLIVLGLVCLSAPFWAKLAGYETHRNRLISWLCVEYVIHAGRILPTGHLDERAFRRHLQPPDDCIVYHRRAWAAGLAHSGRRARCSGNPTTESSAPR